MGAIVIEPDPDVHNSTDPGCDACSTCMAHDGCADPDNPHDEKRGDCAECGACGDCVRDCMVQRSSDIRQPSFQDRLDRDHAALGGHDQPGGES